MCVCVYLCLRVGLQSEEAAHLSALSVNDPGSNKVGGIGIHPIQQSHTKAYDLQNKLQETHRTIHHAELLVVPTV